MAVKFINKMTGTEMWVDDSRVGEYKKLGYRPAESKKSVMETKETEKEAMKVEKTEPVKAPAKPKMTKSNSVKKTTRKR